MKDLFIKNFNKSDAIYSYFSPGRVNLIGEHIDYNGGLVLPAAIQLGTYGLVSKNNDLFFRFMSLNYIDVGITQKHISDLEYKVDDGWVNYAKGILFTLIQKGYSIPFGFDLLVKGDLPTASGLSSSASLEALVCFIANDFYDLKMTRVEMALLCQEVENNYMNMHCGIMDQLVILCGIKNKALLMNTNTLEISLVNAQFNDYTWIIMNTNYQRKTTESKYNERRFECESALSILKEYKKINYLCDLKVDEFNQLSKYIKNETKLKRARHAVTEMDRTLKAKIALETNDPILFGNLLDASHESLKNDFEVTGKYLDSLVYAAKEFGAIGARVTGAGFGGCAIALVPNKKLNHFERLVDEKYFKETNLHATFYKVNFENGVGEINGSK
jgi:galactokinase